MVFESLVVDLINKYLGDYVVNLDRSQLKLGIWGGDAVLQNLDLKESALDDLDLPVKIKVGHIGKLTLKIPWKNLYTQPVVAILDGVYALVVPKLGIKYNEGKEEAAKQEAKQRKLKDVEEAKKLEAEKDKPAEKTQDTFAEKLATQVIKNLQITVSNIHVRYEDWFTNPKHPFAIGLTLKNLVFQTTDENWKPCILTEAVTQIFKLIRLDCFSLYWNSNIVISEELPFNDLLNMLQSGIAGPDFQPEHQYLIKPISSVAHLRLHTKPQNDNFTIPKIFLTIVFDDIVVALSKSQYDDILEMLESFERMTLVALYRKYRPEVTLSGNSRTWWHYVYTCVLEETVRRRRRMFSWNHIKKHRMVMKEYRKTYEKKLSSKKVSSDMQKNLEEHEKFLDFFSIMLMRQQAEVEAAKLGAKKAVEKSGSWFGGWFGKKEESEKPAEKKLQDQFYELYTPEEKAKLYGAIGYEENEGSTSYPKEYTAVRLVTKLNYLAIIIKDNDRQNPDVLKMQLEDVFSSVAQRPSTNAIQFDAKMDRFTIVGCPQNGLIPKMVLSQVQESEYQTYALLNMKFETNPLDGQCDTRVTVNSQPLEIIYDAVTINQLAVFFKPPESVYLKQLSQAAMNKFDDIKQQSRAGIQHAIQQHKYTDIRVDLKSSYVIVPEGGFYKKEASRLVLDLGNLKISSEKNQTDASKTKMESMEVLMQSAYDKFNIQLESIQLMFVHLGDDWQRARKLGQSNMHILRPISINILFQKCMFDNQSSMAKMKAFGEIPLLSLAISDHRLHEILKLVDSIPFPESSPPVEEEFLKGPSTLPSGDSVLTSGVSLKLADQGSVERGSTDSSLTRSPSQDQINAIDMELKFEIKEVNVNISQRIQDEDVPLLKFVVDSLGTEMTTRTFDMSAEAYLGGIYLQHLKFKACEAGPLVNLINTPVSDEKFKLLTVGYLKANPDGPEFSSTYKNTEQSIRVSFSMLELLLHQDAIVDLLKFAQTLIPPSEKPPQEASLPAAVVAPEKDKDAIEKKSRQKKKVKPKDPNVVDVRVDATLELFSVGICTADRLLTEIKIKGINAGVTVQQEKTSVVAVLKDMTIYDPSSECLYPKILTIEGSEILDLNLIIYNSGTEGDKYSDMSCADTKVNVSLGCMRFVFLNKFINDLLGFLNHFQAAKDKIKEAGETMAEYSKETVASLQETASRVALSVKMKAPVIIVPRNSRSSNVLLVDLGNLTLANSFHIAGESSSGVPPVLDKMCIELTSLKISRALMTEKNEIGAECLLLEPVTIKLNIIRNLAAAWFHDLPDLDVGGTLEAVMVQMSQYDFTTIMCVLNENMTEGQPPPSPSVSVKTPEAKPVQPETDGRVQKPAPVADVHTALKLDFKVLSLSARLYSGKDDLAADQTSKVLCRDPGRALASFELEMIALKGEMKSDNSMNFKVILKDTKLDDIRPVKANGITRMIQRNVGGQLVNSGNMIDVDFTQTLENKKTVLIKVNSLHICVCLDYLMAVGDFFTKGMPEAVSPPPRQVEKPSQAKEVPTPPSPPPPEGEMTVQVTIDQPEIILIEDQSNPSSNALVLYTSIMFKMRSNSERQTLGAEVKDLQIISCIFDKRSMGGSQILNSCEIAFHSSAPYGEGQHMNIQTSDMVLNISPATIRTMTAIASAVSVQPNEAATKKEDVVPADLWIMKALEGHDLWYLKSNVAETEPEVTAIENQSSRGEQMLMEVPMIVVKLEGGVGKQTVPLLIVESSFQGEVRDWSSKLYVTSSLSIEVASYNEALAVWEPLLEPVFDNGKRRRWELNVELMKNDDLPPLPEDDSEAVEILPPPRMSLNIHSSDELLLSLTKTCLEVLNNLGEAFGEAYQLVEPTGKAGEATSPYVIRNHTGLELVLKLDNSFKMPTNADGSRVRLSQHGQLELYERDSSAVSRKSASFIKATQEGEERKILFQVEQFGATREVIIKRAEKRLFQINKRSYTGDVWSVVCHTQASFGQKIVNFESIIQIHNHLSVSVEIFYAGDTKLESCGVADSDKLFNVPLEAVYCNSSEFHFSPVDVNYVMSNEPINWKAVENKGMYQISCDSHNGQGSFYINVCPEIEEVYFESQNKPSAKTYILHLHPTVIIHNLMPMELRCLLETNSEKQNAKTNEEIVLNPGENTPLFNACISQSTLEVRIMKYQGKEWIGKRCLEMNLPELSVWNFESHDGSTKITMNMGLHYKAGGGSLDMSFYSPYWMINKTGKDLIYKVSDDDSIQHPAELEECVLFSFKSKSIFGKKKSKDEKPKKRKTSLKVSDSDWSDKFSLDTVGSSGTVTCKSKTRTYEVGVKIHLSSSGLTKIVTFTPYYIVVNTSQLAFLLREVDKENSSMDWFEVEPEKCLPFWPVQANKIMRAKVKGATEETNEFPLNKAHSTLLRLDNEFGGMGVECHVTESVMVTTLTSYKPGTATVLIVNHIAFCSIQFQQSGVKTLHVLGSEQMVLYTWENALGTRQLIWSCGEKKNEKTELTQDGIGDFFADSDTKVYWASFLDGMQRVLLFTQDLNIATSAQQAGELERIEQEINVNIQGMGLSLINNKNQTEVAYLGITSTGIIWEEKKKRFKAMNIKNSTYLETAYQRYLDEITVGKQPQSRMILENKMDIDFKEMLMYRPNKRKLRRSFQNGIWVQYKTSPHQLQFHAKINRLQLDNQISGAVFQTVLAPIPPPKSVAVESVPRPFTEVSIMLRKHEHSNIAQIRYFKVLIQEMSAKVDQGFLNAIIQLFTSDVPVSRDQETIFFKEDCKQVQSKLIDVVGLSLAEEQRNFYDYLHFSPIKIHLSFSLQGGGAGGEEGDSAPTQIQANVVNIFLQSVGVVLTDVQDVVFKLGYFERNHCFYNQTQLFREMSRHYAGQAIKQMYVLVLGLDVLGNPFGLLRGLGEGIEDLFYEPYQGAIQGPEEFAEGLVLGVRSLFGHAVGGAAGAVSRITGTLGKGIAALTLDDDYQRKRREAMNKKPANVREGFARGGKGLVMGVVDGVTGIVRKPVEGAQKEGVEGFFKGIGRGLVGVVTRPTSGVIDFASSSLDSIRRIAEMSEDIGRLRPPRRFYNDQIIRPYNFQEAEGYAILHETEKGKFALTDEYTAHVVVTKDRKNVLLVTDSRLIFASRGDIFGHWDCNWAYTWNELKELPKKTNKGMEVVLKLDVCSGDKTADVLKRSLVTANQEKEKKKLFGSSSTKKLVMISDPKLVEWIVLKIQDAMEKTR